MRINNTRQNHCLAKHNQKIQEALRGVESSFANEMIKPIFENTVEGTSNKIYQSMMVEEYGKFI